MRFGRALIDAFRATSTLYKRQLPLPTSIGCMKKVEFACDRYRPINAARAESIKERLDTYVASLDVRSVEYGLEKDYLRKYYVARNYYVPENLRDQASVAKWFLGGPQIAANMKNYLEEFWSRVVPSNYHMLTPSDIECPSYDASGGVSFIRVPGGGFEWAYLKKGPNWSAMQDGTVEWFKDIIRAVPDNWLNRSISSLITDNNRELESLTLERPVIRTESGPHHVRLARSSSSNLHILGRMVMKPIQKALWPNDLSYIGLAMNAQVAGIKCTKGAYDDWYIGTHGDDWIAWCPVCERFHSGDWSNFDLHVTANQLLASYEALYSVISSRLGSREEHKLFYALAYLAIRAPIIWLWDREGRESLSIRRTLGKVRSGSGDFVMHNNAVNQACLQLALRSVHGSLRREHPCRSKLWWQRFAEYAKREFGWIAKPSAQFTHPHGFFSCRCIHTISRRFKPSPCVSSVVRNWVNPYFDPEEYPKGCSPIWLAARFRDMNKTLAWSDEDVAKTTMDGLFYVAEEAGIHDILGMNMDQSELSRAIQMVVGQYSTGHYLEGSN